MSLLVTIFTDASFCHKTHAAGWAAWIKCNGQTTRIARAFKGQIRSSGDAEVLAAVNAICFTIAGLHLGIADRIILQSDCEKVQHVLNTRRVYKCQTSDSGKAALAALKACYERHGHPTVEVRYVKAHQGTVDKRAAVNTFVDREARKQMEQVRATLRQKREDN